MSEKDLEQIVLQGLQYEATEKEKAAERKALTRKNGLKPEEAKFSDGTVGQTRDIVAKKLGISGKHWERMKFVYLHKDDLSDEEYQDWKTGNITTSKLYNQLCKVYKYTEVIDAIIETMKQLEDDILKYGKSYTDVDFKHKLASTIYNYKEETKKSLNDSFQKVIEEKQDFAGNQWSNMVSLRGRLELLKYSIKRNKK